MKLCVLITGLGIGGAEKHLLKVLPRVSFDKFVVSLTGNDEIGKKLEEQGVKVYYLAGNLFSKIFKFKKILAKEKPDVLDTYLIHSNIFGRFFGVDKIINSVRNDYSDFKILNFIDRFTQGLVDLYVPNSEALIPYLRNNKIPMDKIKVVPNCVSEIKIDKGYSVKKELDIEDHEVVVCVARLCKQKDQETLIKAMKYLKEVVLVLVGDGPDRERLEKIAEDLNIDAYFLGSRDDVPNIVNSSDVFVLPSLKEGMSNALLEAMYLGKNCVVSDISQNKILINHDNGFVFAVGDEKDLATNIKLAMKKDLGKFAKKTVQKNYTVDKIVERYEVVLKNEEGC